ncbi:MAG TPA: twin-arginine translocase TatA/TatE family subunit [Methanosarcinales archaeon]|nr:twin-arginine translocase TatA/TatE family subunit [Methanosarcinales archaeon]
MFGGTIGGGEFLLIGLAILLLFGATKVPELARSLGKSIGEFKKAQRKAEFELNQLTKLETSDSSKNEKENSERSEASTFATKARMVGEQIGDQSKIQKMAEDLGIETKDKTEEELLDEIQKKIKEKKY